MTRVEVERGIEALNTITRDETKWPKDKMRAVSYLRGLLDIEMRRAAIREAMDAEDGA